MGSEERRAEGDILAVAFGGGRGGEGETEESDASASSRRFKRGDFYSYGPRAQFQNVSGKWKTMLLEKNYSCSWLLKLKKVSKMGPQDHG